MRETMTIVKTIVEEMGMEYKYGKAAYHNLLKEAEVPRDLGLMFPEVERPLVDNGGMRIVTDVTIFFGRQGDLRDDYDEKYEANIIDMKNAARMFLMELWRQPEYEDMISVTINEDINLYDINIDGVLVAVTLERRSNTKICYNPPEAE